MKRLMIGSIALVLVAMPLMALGAIGAAFLASPNEQPAEFEPVALDTIGLEPREVRLHVMRRDAWMQGPEVFYGIAFVRRNELGELVVLSAIHPRMGDPLEYDPTTGYFQSVCFHTRYDFDGRFLPDPNYSYRAVDMLRLEHRVEGKQLFIRAPFPRPTYFTESD